MLQRIQTIFLISAKLVLGSLFAFPLATAMIGQGGEGVMRATHFPTIIIQIIAYTITLITIFLYKKRMLQIRLCVFNCVLLLGYQGYVIWKVYLLSQIATAMQLSVTLVAPLLAAILTFLALRGIAKDEALVRSLDRLR